MARKTIQELTALTLPAVGTDLVPVVRSSAAATKVALADLPISSAVQAALDAKISEAEAIDLNLTGMSAVQPAIDVDGGDSWATAIAAAITDATANDGGTIFLPNTEISGVPITLGNGSSAQYSTYGGVGIEGVGHPFQRINNPSSPMIDQGTRLKATGAGSVVSIAGPYTGAFVKNIAIDGDGVATTGLSIISATNMVVENCVFVDCATGVSLDTVSVESIGGVTEAIASANIIFRNCQWVVPDNGIGIDLDGFLGSAANGWDSVRVRFENCYMLVSRVGGTGVKCTYTDQIDFSGLYMTGYGTADGNQASYRLVACRTAPGNFAFPQNLRGFGNVDIGQQLPIVIDRTAGKLGPGIRFDGITLLDEQDLGDPGTDFLFNAVSPAPAGHTGVKGGKWHEHGTAREEVGGLKNRLLNSGFNRFSRGYPSPLGAGAYFADELVSVFDSSVTATASPVAFTPGQTEVPGEPLYYLEIDVTAASGNSFFIIGWRIPNFDTFSGAQASLSAFLASNVTGTWGGRIEQTAGSGGSGGGSDEAESFSVPGDGVFRPYNLIFDVPSLVGATRGAKDNLAIYFRLPVNTVGKFRIAIPQFTGGGGFPAYETRPENDLAMMDRDLYRFPCLSGLVGYGRVADANTVILENDNQMRFQPSVIASAASTFAVGGVTCTSGPAIAAWSEQGQTLVFTATAHGLTVGSLVAITTSGGSILLSAEY